MHAAHERALDADTESLHSMLQQAQAQVAQLTAEGKVAAAAADTSQATEAELRRQLVDLQRRAERHEDEAVATANRVSPLGNTHRAAPKAKGGEQHSYGHGGWRICGLLQAQQLSTEIQRLGSVAAAAEAEVGRLQAREAALVATGERAAGREAQLQEAHSQLQTTHVALEDQLASLQVRIRRREG